MGSTGKCVVSFFVGVAAGIGGSIAYKKIGERIEAHNLSKTEEAEEREKVEASNRTVVHFQKKEDDAESDDEEHIVSITNDEPPLTDEEIAKLSKPLTDEEIAKLSKPIKWADKNGPYSALSRRERMFKQPYIIEECQMGDDGYRVEATVYYADGVLADSDDHIISITDTVGQAAINLLGTMTEDGPIEALCVRNERLQTDFEITADVRTFVDLCLQHPEKTPAEYETLEAITDPDGAAKREAEEYEDFRQEQSL